EGPGFYMCRVVAQGLLQVPTGRSRVMAREIDEGQVVVGSARLSTLAKGLLQVRPGPGKIPFLVVEDAPVQCCAPELGCQIQGAAVVPEGLTLLAPGGVGQGPVVIAFRRSRRERNGHAEGMNGVGVVLSMVSADATEEVSPEVLRAKVRRLL